MNSFDLLFYRKLRERLKEESETRAEFILNGSYTTLEDYKNAVGYLKAISGSSSGHNHLKSSQQTSTVY